MAILDIIKILGKVFFFLIPMILQVVEFFMDWFRGTASSVASSALNIGQKFLQYLSGSFGFGGGSPINFGPKLHDIQAILQYFLSVMFLPGTASTCLSIYFMSMGIALLIKFLMVLYSKVPKYGRS